MADYCTANSLPQVSFVRTCSFGSQLQGNFVLVGVGFIHRGNFHLLFNALLPSQRRLLHRRRARRALRLAPVELWAVCQCLIDVGGGQWIRLTLLAEGQPRPYREWPFRQAVACSWEVVARVPCDFELIVM